MPQNPKSGALESETNQRGTAINFHGRGKLLEFDQRCRVVAKARRWRSVAAMKLSSVQAHSDLLIDDIGSNLLPALCLNQGSSECCVSSLGV